MSVGGGGAAGLFLDEDFGEAEAAAGQFPSVLIPDEGNPLFADFGKEDFPSFAGQGFRVDFGAWPQLAWRRSWSGSGPRRGDR